MLGALLVVDGVAYLACCGCLSYLGVCVRARSARTHAAIDVRDGAWRGDAYLCARCLAAAGAGTATPQVGAGVVKCRQCNRGCRVGVEGCRGTVAYDDLSVGAERFVDVYLCGKHAATAAWLARAIARAPEFMARARRVWGAPNYHSLSTLDRGLRLHWRTLTAWNPRINYLLSGGAEAAMEAQAGSTTNKRKRAAAATATATTAAAAVDDADAAEEHAAVAHAVHATVEAYAMV